MFQWIQTKKWLPDLSIGLVFASILAVIDYNTQGSNGLIASVILGFSFFFFREYSYIAIPLILGGCYAELALNLHPTAAGFSLALLVFISSALGPRRWSLLIMASAILTGVLVAWSVAFNTAFATEFFGINVYNSDGRWWGFGFAAVSIVGLNGFAWLLGGFLIEFYRERVASKERDIVQSHNLRTMLEIAEQNERFLIASDLNEAALERVSAMLTLTDGARYAAKLDPAIATRTLDRLVDIIRDAHDELRRLFDMLNQSVQVASAPPNINDLAILAVQLRQEGYQTKIVHQGKRFSLIPSAELSIYRIVYDAVDNVKQHAPANTSIDIDFMWHDNGLQVLVKDNGQEVAQRDLIDLDSSFEQAVNEDVEALTQEVTGPGITGMRERAALFQGNVEAHRVPGVGFTLNAIFPNIHEYREAVGE
ncbi:MAG: hypothetical protein RJA35_771 [Actinomycetota bacterium]